MCLSSRISQRELKDQCAYDDMLNAFKVNLAKRIESDSIDKFILVYGRISESRKEN